MADARQRRRFVVALLLIVACLFQSGMARAGSDAQVFREQAAAVRSLAENDARRAYHEAQLLQAELPADAVPADRANMLNLLARIEIYLALTDASARHADQALELAGKHGDAIGQAEAHLNIALIAINQGRIKAVVAASKNALTLLDGVDRPDLLGEAMLRTGMTYRRQGQIVESVTMAMQTLEIAQRSKDPLALTYAELGLAIAFEQGGHQAEARDHYARMREQARAAGSRQLEGAALRGQSSAVLALGDVRSAESLARESIAIFRAVGMPFNTCFSLYALAGIERQQGRRSEAVALLDEMAAVYRRHPNPIGLWWTLNARSGDLLALGRVAAAAQDAQRAYLLAKEIGFPFYLAESAKRQAETAAAQGDHKRAYELAAESFAMTVRANQEKVGEDTLKVTEGYQLQSRQREIDELKHKAERQASHERWLWTLLGAAFIILAGSLYFVTRLRNSHRLLESYNAQLRQSEELVRSINVGLEHELRALAEFSPGMMASFHLRHDGSLCMPYVSPSIRELFGLAPQDVAEDTKLLMARIHPDDGQRMLDSCVESARTLTQWHVEYRILHPGKGERWMECSLNPEHHLDGGVVWYGYTHDVTERKRAQLELEQSLDFTEGIINAVPDLLFEFDREGRYLNIWSQDDTLLAAQREALLGKTVREVLEPESAATAMSILAEADETGHSFGKVLRIELSRGPCWFEQSVAKKSGRGIKADTFIGLSRDVTERKRMEDALRAREEEFRALAELSPDTIGRYDRDCRCIYANPALAADFGRPSGSALGVTPEEFLPGSASSSAYGAAIREVLGDGKERNFTLAWTDAARGALWSDIRLVPERHRDGSIASVLAIGRDITGLKRYEEARSAALAEAERLTQVRSSFLAQMSHELRTPLNGILGYAQVLQRTCALDARQMAGLGVIERSADQLLIIINDILDFAKIEAGKVELALTEIPLHGFLHAVADSVGMRAEQKGLLFVCDIAADLPAAVRADERLLRQVLLNLLSNAIRFTDHGEIGLHATYLPPGRLRFAVHDTGIGIDAAQTETIFEPFEQATGSRWRPGGTGLGLAISRYFVRQMGGEIQVDSRVGAGSTFWFELAAAPVAGVTAPAVEPPVIVGYEGPRRRILVAEDMAETRTLLVDMLEPLGFDLTLAANGRECLEQVQALKPDLLLVDTVMPEIDGYEVTRRLRKTPGFERLPIVGISAKATSLDRENSLALGASDFLAKPVAMDRLLACIGELLSIDWIGKTPDAASAPTAGTALTAPPLEEMQTLHRLALQGNMGDILRHVDELLGLDVRYHPFADRLRQLATGYQSKAILRLVEQHLERERTE